LNNQRHLSGENEELKHALLNVGDKNKAGRVFWMRTMLVLNAFLSTSLLSLFYLSSKVLWVGFRRAVFEEGDFRRGRFSKRAVFEGRFSKGDFLTVFEGVITHFSLFFFFFFFLLLL
jgi:hypothetical protein